MKTDIWYFDDFDFKKIICPYKLEDHVNKNPTRKYHLHEFLFFEEDLVTEIFLIDRGKVKVGHYDLEGNESVVVILGSGDVIGQMAILGETHHHCFAEVVEEGTQVCRMSISKAKELTRDYVPFALEINRRIGDHIRKLERRIEILLFKDVKLRLMEFLKDMAIDHGRSRDGGIYISHNLTQSDFALLIASSRKSASLMLNALRNDGIIQFSRKHIFIPDPGRLEQVVLNRKMSVA